MSKKKDRRTVDRMVKAMRGSSCSSLGQVTNEQLLSALEAAGLIERKDEFIRLTSKGADAAKELQAGMKKDMH